MNFLRIYVVVLMLGWFLWLALDKHPPEAAVAVPPPPAPYSLPLPERPGYPGLQPPPPDAGLMADFQYAVDTLKAGQPRRGFVVVWPRRYWALTGVITLLSFVAVPPLWRLVRRRKSTVSGGKTVTGKEAG
jgi:hypothetical protein